MRRQAGHSGEIDPQGIIVGSSAGELKPGPQFRQQRNEKPRLRMVRRGAALIFISTAFLKDELDELRQRRFGCQRRKA
jgi:hypothetical protein